MIEALNSSNFFYRWFYLLMIKMSRLNSNVQWMLIIGLWLGMRFLNGMAQKNPDLLPWVVPISLLYMLFVMMSWIMQPLFNTMLRFHPFGKHLLSEKEKWASNLIAGVIVFSIVLGFALVWVLGEWIIIIIPILTGIYLTIPLVVPFRCDPPWAIAVATVVASLFGLIYLLLHAALFFDIFLQGLFMIYIYGILIYCFAGQILMKAEQRY
jgi:hypothetical protein